MNTITKDPGKVSVNAKKKLESCCKWCGQPFIKKHNRQMYCSEEHRRYARQEQQKNYYHRTKNIFKHLRKDDKYFGLGSGGISAHANSDFCIEGGTIKKEMKRLNLR